MAVQARLLNPAFHIAAYTIGQKDWSRMQGIAIDFFAFIVGLRHIKIHFLNGSFGIGAIEAFAKFTIGQAFSIQLKRFNFKFRIIKKLKDPCFYPFQRL